MNTPIKNGEWITKHKKCREQKYASPIRSDRFFKLNHHWFFATREGATVGPFDSMVHAEEGANDYIEFSRTCSNKHLDHFRTELRYGT